MPVIEKKCMPYSVLILFLMFLPYPSLNKVRTVCVSLLLHACSPQRSCEVDHQDRMTNLRVPSEFHGSMQTRTWSTRGLVQYSNHYSFLIRTQ